MEQNVIHPDCHSWKPVKKLSDLPDTYHWKDILRSAVNMRLADDRMAGKACCLTAQGMQLQPFCGAILTGSQGNGRHSTAEALAGTITAPHYVRLYGAELDYEAPDRAIAAVNALGQTAAREKGLCLLLDDPQHCRHSRMIQTRLLRMLEETKDPLYLIIVTDKPESVIPGLHSYLLCCHCTPPTTAERKRYLKSQYQWIPQEEADGGKKTPKPTPYKLADFDMTDLAEETEGFSWSQMEQLMRHLRYQLYLYAMNQCKKELEEEEALEQSEAAKKSIRRAAQKAAPQKRISLIRNSKVELNYQQVEQLVKVMSQQNVAAQPVVTQVAAVQPVQNNLDEALKLVGTQPSGPAETPAVEEKPNPLMAEPAKEKPLPFGNTDKLKEASEREIDKNDVMGMFSFLNIQVDLSDVTEEETPE